MKTGKWHDGAEQPKKTGWYLMDYRHPPKSTEKAHELPPFAVDYFISDINGKFWYVTDVYNKALTLNDSWFESLPWCKIKE
jgi:hypothetical protein